MKMFVRSLCLVLLLFFTISAAGAQFTIQEERPRVSRSLAGHVLIHTDAMRAEPLRDITVELCGPKWESVLTSTKTDKDGYFVLQKPATGKIFYLRFRADGFSPYEVRVRIKRFGAKNLKVYMQIAM